MLSKIVIQEDSVAADLGACNGTILDIIHAYYPRASLLSIAVDHLQTLQAGASFIPVRNDIATNVLQSFYLHELSLGVVCPTVE
jgi:hypothetical protein